MIKDYLDLTCTGTDEKMFKLPIERLDEMNLELINLEIDCAANRKDFTIFSTAESPGDGLHSGKLLERVLSLAKTPQEEIAFLYAFSSFMVRVNIRIDEAIYLEKIQPQTKQ